MTPTQKRNALDVLDAKAIEIRALKLIDAVQTAKERGLWVDCNVSTRAPHRTNGYLTVMRPFENKAIMVLKKKAFFTKDKSK